MMHKAWHSIEEVPYYFSRSSIKFQGHMGWKINDFNPIWVRLLGRSHLSNPTDLPCPDIRWPHSNLVGSLGDHDRSRVAALCDGGRMHQCVIRGKTLLLQTLTLYITPYWTQCKRKKAKTLFRLWLASYLAVSASFMSFSENRYQGALLLTWINLNPSMD